MNKSRKKSVKKYIHIKCVLCTGQYTRQWGYSDEQARQDSCLYGEILETRETIRESAIIGVTKKLKYVFCVVLEWEGLGHHFQTSDIWFKIWMIKKETAMDRSESREF